MKKSSSALLGAIAIGFIVSTQPTAADPSSWSVAATRGVTLSLIGGEWQEIEPGAVVTDLALRTLASGSLSVWADNAMVVIGPGSAARFSSIDDRHGTLIQQYAGSLQIAAKGARDALAIQAGGLLVTQISGTITLKFGQTGPELSVSSGSVTVRAGDGPFAAVSAGKIVGTKNGVIDVRPSSNPMSSVQQTAAISDAGGANATDTSGSASAASTATGGDGHADSSKANKGAASNSSGGTGAHAGGASRNGNANGTSSGTGNGKGSVN